MDCLALRQKLKEKYRARLRKEAGGGAVIPARKENADNYGNFFGPSEIGFADRVVQELKLWSGNPTLADKIFKTDGDYDLEISLKSMEKREKVEWLKESRDYSFLSSENEISGKKSVSGQEVPKKNCFTKDGKNSRVSDGMKEKKCNAKTLESTKKTTAKEVRDSKKTYDFNYLMKGKYSKTVNKVSHGRKHVSYVKSKKPYEHMKKSCKEDSVIKQKATTAGRLPQSQQKNINPDEEWGIKRKQEQLKKEYDGMDANSIVRILFEYDPTEYSSDDEDDLNMVTSFADIQKEERRSAKIAKKEDDEELIRKIVQEQSKKLKRI
ncbi:hypothetical protein BUALT_Bualt01G0058800 [Buddleja alternifolia]|uniref:Protein SPT2 homolog n=1 Tax=Buddleja alternifolia TaxID=168488 RepID=A0AAV6Y8W8_9LAMI|nr:hypothetical protein BUALT_Bualt01G0058800 [Buddleja alternifolia]